MEQLVQGAEYFRTNVYPSQSEFFENLAKGQSPVVLVITCADSRIDPNLITRARPGEIFHLRSAGNIVPAYGAFQGAEAATIEYAVKVLGIRNIVVCGHTDCGAMRGLLAPEKIQHLPAVTHWLKHAEAALHTIDCASFADEDDRLRAVTEANVLAQIQSLQTHPAVNEMLRRGEMHLFGWIFDIANGRILAYQPARNSFAPLHAAVEEFDIAARAGAAGGEVAA